MEDEDQNQEFDKLTKKEIALLTNQLTGLLKGLEGIRIMVDLRNEHTLIGTVVYVDGFMNIDFSDVCYYCDLVYQPNTSTYFDKFLLKNRLIRYVHLPNTLNTQHTLQEVIKRYSQRYLPSLSRNHKLMKRHLKVLESLNKITN